MAHLSPMGVRVTVCELQWGMHTINLGGYFPGGDDLHVFALAEPDTAMRYLRLDASQMGSAFHPKHLKESISNGGLSELCVGRTRE